MQRPSLFLQRPICQFPGYPATLCKVVLGRSQPAGVTDMRVNSTTALDSGLLGVDGAHLPGSGSGAWRPRLGSGLGLGRWCGRFLGGALVVRLAAEQAGQGIALGGG